MRSTLITAAALALIALLGGCSDDRVSFQSASADLPTRPPRDVPPIMRDMIGSEASIDGLSPILISGYGLVVGLDGTGSGDIPVAIRTVLTQEMARMRVGQASGGVFADITPDELIDDPNTAVVIVRSVVEPGAPIDSRFDVLVQAVPGTSTTSLRNGRLYTTRLFRGEVFPGMPDQQPIAHARGEVFMNPFARTSPGATADATETLGRVLGGGTVIQENQLVLSLDSPSHARASAIRDAINRRFPSGRGEPDTAIGRNEDIVLINVPRQYRERTNDFIQILLHTRVDQRFRQEWARRYAQSMADFPSMADQLSWAMTSLGEVALPHVRGLYDHPQPRPRLAAIQTGARLGDPTVRSYLEEVILEGPASARNDAMLLIAQLPPDPKINLFLRDMLADDDVFVRVAAYEALAERRDPWISRTRPGGKFVLDQVPSPEPAVYVRMQDEPKIVVLGEEVPINQPVIARAWNDELMVSSRESSAARVDVFYRDSRRGRITQDAIRPMLPELIEYLGHETTPEQPAPGLDLTYTQVVGAIYELLDDGVAPAVFVAESDRLQREVLLSLRDEAPSRRPELAGETEAPAETIRPEPTIRPETTQQTPARPADRQWVVPLPGRPQPSPEERDR
ncbi:MAG: flagellar basal body P-ring protein FlgI [Planctomycetota bacterium]